MKDKIFIGIAAFMFIGFLTYGGYQLNRYINWSWGYEDMVEKKIREMVKKESLNEN